MDSAGGSCKDGSREAVAVLDGLVLAQGERHRAGSHASAVEFNMEIHSRAPRAERSTIVKVRSPLLRAGGGERPRSASLARARGAGLRKNSVPPKPSALTVMSDDVNDHDAVPLIDLKQHQQTCLQTQTKRTDLREKVCWIGAQRWDLSVTGGNTPGVGSTHMSYS